MLRYVFLLNLLILVSMISRAQVSIAPTISPSTFNSLESITITYDVTGTALASLDDAYIWVWIPDGSVDAKYNINPASSNDVLSSQARFQKNVSGGIITFSITFVPQDFFQQPICLEEALGFLIKGNDWADGQSADNSQVMTPLSSCFVVNLTSPTLDPVFIAPDEDLVVSATSSEAATFTLYINEEQVDQQIDISEYTTNQAPELAEGLVPVRLEVANDENDTTITFQYLINTPSEEQVRPAGVIPGINYDPTDPTTATLCLWAPDKDATYLLGEFNGFEIDVDYKMYRDGAYFWLKLDGLNAGHQYAFQYLVDGIYIADPFADQILDPGDVGIPSTTYPDLKAYPAEAIHDEWYKNRLSILQTDQMDFEWQFDNEELPKQTDLVIYELLIRDFLEADERSYTELIKRLPYLRELGVNAIELMPIQEFGGNDSWGYNPSFMFAPDKAYGTKIDLKAFIDAAHSEGMAVLLDIVFNQQDTPNPFLSLWFDFTTFNVQDDNPMFNTSATHPFNVFFDMNHESSMTQYYMDTTLHYWLSEYHVDGFRFDLSKGFTQNVSEGETDAVGKWSQYDQGRIDLLKRMYDRVRTYDTESYLILEHFAANDEETELANHGFMLWGNMHWDYKDLILGVGKDITWGDYASRGWENPNLVTYMESHDEERLMYEYLVNDDTGRDDRDDLEQRQIALDRIKLANAFFYTIPGPKMLWQFGELGYDESINHCPDGSVDGGCRTSSKPIYWSYFDENDRRKQYDFLSDLIKLKTELAVFENGEVSISAGNSLVKEISLKNNESASPSSANEASVYVVGNFDFNNQTSVVSFPYTGTWYDYFRGGEALVAEQTQQNITLGGGEFRFYVNYELEFPEEGLLPIVTQVRDLLDMKPSISLFPNPSQQEIQIQLDGFQDRQYEINIMDMTGRNIFKSACLSDHCVINVSKFNAGLYCVMLDSNGQTLSTRFIKN